MNKALTTGKPIDIHPDGELQVAAQTAAILQELQAAVMLAKHFPRDYDKCWAALMKSCQRMTLARAAQYSYPRGGQTIAGPSVNLARVAGQCYGNIRWGLSVLRDDLDEMLIEGWAWDMEANNKVSMTDAFKKLIFRKKGGWIKPDERDLRELVMRRGAILIRNCLLNILPRDYIEDAVGVTKKTLREGIKDPEGEKKSIILQFQKLGVTVEMLNGYVGSKTWDTENIVGLQQILNAINDGQAKRSDYFDLESERKPEKGGLSTDDMSPGEAGKHQGYEKPGKPETAKDEAGDTLEVLIKLPKGELITRVTDELATTFADTPLEADKFLVQIVEQKRLNDADISSDKNNKGQLANLIIDLQDRQAKSTGQVKAGF